MDRNTNINCLSIMLATFKRTSDDSARLRIRQAMYVHEIVDAVLTERVDLLPEASFAPVEAMIKKKATSIADG